MGKLLAKELRLSIHPMFFVVPFLMGLLFLIPQWPFLIALMYFFFVSIPNIHGAYNAQNDNGFSIMMPICKKDMVRARVAAMSILEILHIIAGILFASLNHLLYRQPNFALDTNMAFFGFGFLMFGLFNVVFFPMYYRTGYRYGLPTIVAVIVTVVYAAVVELSVVFFPGISAVLEGTVPSARIAQGAILVSGVVAFALLSIAACCISSRRFELADL